MHENFFVFILEIWLVASEILRNFNIHHILRLSQCCKPLHSLIMGEIWISQMFLKKYWVEVKKFNSLTIAKWTPIIKDKIRKTSLHSDLFISEEKMMNYPSGSLATFLTWDNTSTTIFHPTVSKYKQYRQHVINNNSYGYCIYHLLDPNKEKSNYCFCTIDSTVKLSQMKKDQKNKNNAFKKFSKKRFKNKKQIPVEYKKLSFPQHVSKEIIHRDTLCKNEMERYVLDYIQDSDFSNIYNLLVQTKTVLEEGKKELNLHITINIPKEKQPFNFKKQSFLIPYLHFEIYNIPAKFTLEGRKSQVVGVFGRYFTFEKLKKKTRTKDWQKARMEKMDQNIQRMKEDLIFKNFFGPVKKIDTKPEEKPIIRKFLYGVIDENGRFYPTPKFFESFLSYEDSIEHSPKQSLLPFLTCYNNAIVECSGELGKLSNTCLFCGHPLTDQFSLQKGYGSTCAKNLGLNENFLSKNSIRVGTNSQIKNALSIQELSDLSKNSNLDISETARNFLNIALKNQSKRETVQDQKEEKDQKEEEQDVLEITFSKKKKESNLKKDKKPKDKDKKSQEIKKSIDNHKKSNEKKRKFEKEDTDSDDIDENLPIVRSQKKK